MSFSITKKSFGIHLLYELTDLASLTRVGIVASCGAILNNFSVKTDQAIEVINGYKSGEDLDENIAKNFKGVMLSPFANRVNKATYNFNNTKYILAKVWKEKDYAIHGYLFNQKFDVISETSEQDKATLILKNKYDGTMPGFPFTFETTVTYILSVNNTLHCKTVIENTSEASMPLSFGWHPLFFNDVNINETLLEFQAQYEIGVDEGLIPTGKKIPNNTFNTSRKIDNTFFDTCFKLSEAESGLTKLTLKEPSNKIMVELNIETGIDKFKYLQIYIPPKRNTIALEPMSSWPDAFNNHEDLISLQPNKTVEFKYSIKVSTF